MANVLVAQILYLANQELVFPRILTFLPWGSFSQSEKRPGRRITFGLRWAGKLEAVGPCMYR